MTAAVVARATALLVAMCALSSGCSASTNGDDEGRRALLATRTTQGVAWTLWAEESRDGLCLSLSGPETSRAVWSGGCGFGPHNPEPGDDDGLVSEIMSGLAPDGTVILYGPTPARAVTVRLTPGDVPDVHVGGQAAPVSGPRCLAKNRRPVTVPVTGSLPSWTSPGGWFLAHVQNQGCVYDVAFLDRSGRALPQTRFS